MREVKHKNCNAQAIMSAWQCRASRGALGWSQDVLAQRAKVSRSMVVDFEKGQRGSLGATVAAIQGAIEAAGVSFSFNEDGTAALSFGDGGSPLIVS